METVQYWERPETPDRTYFRCERMRASISTAACQSMWRKSNGDDKPEREACRCCPLGAQHAGELQASMSPLKGTLTCARCHRPAGRLIGGHTCVSCKNREYEFLKGRNAKGTPPTMKPLCRRRLRYVSGGVACSLLVLHSMDTDELVVAALRDNTKRVLFGFGVAVPQAVRQLRLF